MATRQQTPITPSATAIPIPAFAPLLSPVEPLDVTFKEDPPVMLAAAEPDVLLLAVDAEVCDAPVADDEVVD